MSNMPNMKKSPLLTMPGTAPNSAVPPEGIDEITGELVDILRDMAYSLNVAAVILRRIAIKQELVKTEEFTELENPPQPDTVEEADGQPEN